MLSGSSGPRRARHGAHPSISCASTCNAAAPARSCQADRAEQKADQALTELSQARERVARLEGEAAGVRAMAIAAAETAERKVAEKIAAQEMVIAELQHALEHHQRPWWRKLFG
jgi:hypothetical protein